MAELILSGTLGGVTISLPVDVAFSYGPPLVTGDWTDESGGDWTHGNGMLSAESGASGSIRHDMTLETGEIYRVELISSPDLVGNIRISLGGGESADYADFSGSFDLMAGAGGWLRVMPGSEGMFRGTVVVQVRLAA